MASGRTARRELDFPKPTDAPKATGDIEALANQLDNDVEGGQGKLSERPVAKLRGRVYVVQGDATAENNGIIWWDTGATWLPLNIPSNGQTYIAPAPIAEGEQEPPSAVRSALVSLEVTISGATQGISVTVGGKTVGKVFAPGAVGTFTSTITFEVPPGVKWHITKSTAYPTSVNYTYVLG